MTKGSLSPVGDQREEGRGEQWLKQRIGLADKRELHVNVTVIFTVGIQGNQISSMKNLYSQPLLRNIIVTLHTDTAKAGMLQCSLKGRSSLSN